MTLNKHWSLLATLISTSLSGSVFAADIIQLDTLPQTSINIQGFSQQGQLDHGTQFKVSKKVKLINGKTKYRLQQYYQDVPVFGFTVSAAKDHLGQYTQTRGNAVTNLPQDKSFVTPSITPEQAMAISMPISVLSSAIDEDNIENKETKLWVYLDENNVEHLVYITNYFVNGSQPSRPFTVVDAHSGIVLSQWDGLTTDKIGTGSGGNEKTGKYEYGVDYPNINVTQKGSTCYMNNEHVMTVDLSHWKFWNSWFNKPAVFDCPRHEEKTKKGAYGPVNDAQFFGGVIFDMYNDWFDAAPLDIKLVMRVHYWWGFENAMWNGKNMTFGDGNALFYPLVALDVTAHEVSHGFTEQNSGLIYKGQSGGMNEAFSDMAGEAAKFYMRGSNDFMVGADIVKDEARLGQALRYMDDPTKDGQSISSADDYNSSLNVHHSSGVYNKAFYTLANTEGWDTQSAFETFATANQLYWNANSSFKDGACGVLNAAIDLSRNVEDVLAAFAAVDIKAPCSH
ncbi:peptidase M4 family protein [Parashewanella spongiae]|uniref:Neutral metalloproteinase n=1 Tax=Parashewanella spongiae TaxID=342950 RepID=A0A3A6U8U1_9GAMM|nr:M4 family metallopeptidase [Parashewanella spongiae]MCL1077425.1 M4 family metallopeptidase [Parashewanella spongiae]RJY18358.1 peptidase M4 family protein [Parashewanella spongiae]